MLKLGGRRGNKLLNRQFPTLFSHVINYVRVIIIYLVMSINHMVIGKANILNNKRTLIAALRVGIG